MVEGAPENDARTRVRFVAAHGRTLLPGTTRRLGDFPPPLTWSNNARPAPCSTRPHQPGQLLLPCPFRLLTGLLCPFCGGTRLAYDLMHGDVVTAFHDNAALLVLGVPALAYVLVRWLVAGVRGRHLPLKLTARGNAVVLGTAAVWMVARNLIG